MDEFCSLQFAGWGLGQIGGGSRVTIIVLAMASYKCLLRGLAMILTLLGKYLISLS
jgi:hypothetical protein